MSSNLTFLSYFSSFPGHIPYILVKKKIISYHVDKPYSFRPLCLFTCCFTSFLQSLSAFPTSVQLYIYILRPSYMYYLRHPGSSTLLISSSDMLISSSINLITIICNYLPVCLLTYLCNPNSWYTH